ncbi:hypothetical protein [Komagataeibacter xylinus]|uniref:hypothetical protein n=1 Tax=Komagataeibacter xylinus TaxID=28448 RepID=UPI00103254A5|nr:hypothetical protein [Komagataeibacter xylinus]
MIAFSKCFRSTLLMLPVLALAACGSGAPSKSEVQQTFAAMKMHYMEANGITDATLPIEEKLPKVTVTDSSCDDKAVDGVYVCKLDLQHNDEKNEIPLHFKKVDGTWTILDK